MTLADKIIEFNTTTSYRGRLPDGISIMNPYSESPEALEISSRFYRKFYSDNKPRHLILGINPGRHGAGVTGVPFTDTARMESECGITVKGFNSHELSSVFVYDVINALGGPAPFYSRYYINSVSPLGFTIRNSRGRDVNYNYYDSRELYDLVKPFIVTSLKTLAAIGVNREKCFCLGTGKNYSFLSELNRELKLFGSVIPLEHPRYVMQYKLKQKEQYISKFVSLLDLQEIRSAT